MAPPTCTLAVALGGLEAVPKTYGPGIPLELASTPTFLAMPNGLHDVVPGDLFSWTTRPRNPMAERLSRRLPHEHLTDPMQHSCMSALSPPHHAFASPSRQPHCPVLTGHLTHALHARTHTPLTHVHAYTHTTHIAMSSSLLTSSSRLSA
jgi:hypothetical protein